MPGRDGSASCKSFTVYLPKGFTHTFQLEDCSRDDLADLKTVVLSELQKKSLLPAQHQSSFIASTDIQLFNLSGTNIADKRQLGVLQRASVDERVLLVHIKDEALGFSRMDTLPVSASLGTGDERELVAYEMYKKPFTSTEEFVDNAIEGSKGEALPEIHIELDQIQNVVEIRDNGVGVSIGSRASIVDITNRGASAKMQGQRRKEAALDAGKEGCPEPFAIMRSATLGNFGWGLKGASAFLLQHLKGTLRVVSKCKGNQYRMTCTSATGWDKAQLVVSNETNQSGQSFAEFVATSGTRTILSDVEPSRVWDHSLQNLGEGEAFLDRLATRLASTYDAYLHPVSELAAALLPKLQVLAGSEDKVTSQASMFRDKVKGGPDARKWMNQALEVVSQSAQQAASPERFKLTINLRYRDQDGKEQRAARDCSDVKYKAQTYLRVTCQHAVSCLALMFPVTGVDRDQKEAGGTVQVYLLYVPKAAAGHADLQAAQSRAGVNKNSEEIQALWEMKALSDPVNLRLLDAAKALADYKAEFADLNLECIHGFMLVPKPFETTMNKSGLKEGDNLLDQVRHHISQGQAPHVVGKWLKQVLDEHERFSHISADSQVLIANGANFVRQDIVSLTRRRRDKVGEDLKPFEALHAYFVLHNFEADSSSATEAQDSVVCHLSPYIGPATPANELYSIPLEHYLLSKATASELEAQTWIAPARLQPEVSADPVSPGRPSGSSGKRRAAKGKLSTLMGSTNCQHFALVTEAASETRGRSHTPAVISYPALKKQRWTKAQFEVRPHGTDATVYSPVCSLPKSSANGKVAFGPVGNTQTPEGEWCFDAPGVWDVRLHIGRVPFAPNNLHARGGSSSGQLIEDQTSASISSAWYQVTVEEPDLNHAQSCEFMHLPPSIQRGLPTDLMLVFKRGPLPVRLTEEDVQQLVPSFNFDCDVEIIDQSLEHCEQAGRSISFVKLAGVQIRSDLGDRSIEVTLASTRLQEPLTSSQACCITVGTPNTLLADLQLDTCINEADCELQPRVAFCDEQGGRIGEETPGIQPCLVGPFSAPPSFSFNAEQVWQADMAGCSAQSPLYMATDSEAPGLHAEAIPVIIQQSANSTLSSAPSAADSSPEICLGLLSDSDHQIAAVLRVGDAVQYSTRQSQSLAGVIIDISWNGTAPPSSLHGAERVSRQHIKLKVHPLTWSEDTHLACMAADSRTITAKSVIRQMHVLTQAQARTAFPGGLTSSTIGSAVVIRDDLEDNDALRATWEQVAFMCVFCDGNNMPKAALCCFKQVTITPSPRPTKLLLSRRQIEELQSMTEVQVAEGSAGLRTDEQDEQGNLLLQGVAASTVDDLAALLVNQAGCPTSVAQEKQFSIKCGWMTKSLIHLEPGQRAVQLPSILFKRAYQHAFYNVELRQGKNTLQTAAVKAESMPDGVAAARLITPAQLADPNSSSTPPVVQAGKHFAVVIQLMGKETRAVPWQNAPDHFNLADVRMGFQPDSMIAPELSIIEADGQKHYRATAVLDTRRCQIEAQPLLLTAQVIDSKLPVDSMEVDDSEAQVNSNTISAELPICLERGHPVCAEFQQLPNSVRELSELRFSVLLTDCDMRWATLSPDSSLFLTINTKSQAVLSTADGHDGLYTCKHHLHLAPGNYDVGVATDDHVLGLTSAQQSLALTIEPQDFVVGISATVAPADQDQEAEDLAQMPSGAEIDVWVNLETHCGVPLRVSEQQMRRHCKVKVGRNEFKLNVDAGYDNKDAHQILMHGKLPAKAGEYTLSATWTEERGAHGTQLQTAKRAMQAGNTEQTDGDLADGALAWLLEIDDSGQVKHTSKVQVVPADPTQLMLTDEPDKPLALSVGFEIPEHKWRLSDDNRNTHSDLTGFYTDCQAVRFQADILPAEQEASQASGSAVNTILPCFSCNQSRSYSWSVPAAEEQSACFALPSVVRQLSDTPCGLTGKGHRMELQISAVAGLPQDLQPLRIPFLYSDLPADIGDMTANQEVVDRLHPVKAQKQEAESKAFKALQAAQKALSTACESLAAQPQAAPHMGNPDADEAAALHALQHIADRRQLIKGYVDQWEAAADFRPPQVQGGALHAAALGRQIAIDLPFLTCRAAAESSSEAAANETRWSGGSLSEQEGQVLVQSASVCLQRHIPALVSMGGPEAFAELRRHNPRSDLLPTSAPSAAATSSAAQMYSNPEGLLGFLHDSISIISLDVGRSSDDRYDVSNEAMRCGLKQWLEGSLVFHTMKQATLFVQDRAIHGHSHPPVMALDQAVGGLLRIPGICIAGAAPLPAGGDASLKIGVLGYEASRLSQHLSMLETDLENQDQVVRAWQDAKAKVDSMQQAHLQAETDLDGWLSAHDADLQSALAAVGGKSPSHKRTLNYPVIQGSPPPPPPKKKRV